MRVLVFQHAHSEGIASLAAHMASEGDECDTVHLYAGEPIPDLLPYDAMLVMGGPMDVWEEAEHPWLVPEKAAIGAWTCDLRRPYLGICLGHQLMVEAMGGSCRKMAQPELAVSDVTLNEAGRADPVLGALPSQFQAVHWHGVEADELPAGAQVLAHSSCCAIQAVRVHDHALGLQFHPEVQSGTLSEWMNEPGGLAGATAWLGSEDAARAVVTKGDGMTDAFIERSGIIWRTFRATAN